MVLAALQGNVEVTRYLLDHGGDPAMPDERGSTPLHNAAAAGALSHSWVHSQPLNDIACTASATITVYCIYIHPVEAYWLRF